LSKDRDLDELHATVDKCCEILQRTNDGDELDPADLKLTEGGADIFLDFLRVITKQNSHI
jgi:hypothetical protein